MPTKKRARTERIDFQEELEMDEKRHLAQTLMDQEKKDGKGDIQKAVSLLNECMDLGDTEAMLMLAECYALGLGVDQSMERAEALIIRAEKNGSKEADALLGVINNGRCNGIINFSGLKTNFKIKQCFSRESFFFHDFRFFVSKNLDEANCSFVGLHSVQRNNFERSLSTLSHHHLWKGHQIRVLLSLLLFSGCGIQDEGTETLCKALKTNTTVTKLDLRCEHLKSEHMTKSFFHRLINSTDNDIRCKGAGSLFFLLESTKTLTELNLGCEYEKRTNK